MDETITKEFKHMFSSEISSKKFTTISEKLNDYSMANHPYLSTFQQINTHLIHKHSNITSISRGMSIVRNIKKEKPKCTIGTIAEYTEKISLVGMDKMSAFKKPPQKKKEEEKKKQQLRAYQKFIARKQEEEKKKQQLIALQKLTARKQEEEKKNQQLSALQKLSGRKQEEEKKNQKLIAKKKEEEKKNRPLSTFQKPIPEKPKIVEKRDTNPYRKFLSYFQYNDLIKIVGLTKFNELLGVKDTPNIVNSYKTLDKFYFKNYGLEDISSNTYAVDSITFEEQPPCTDDYGLVSVIMTHYNRNYIVEQAVNSILKQTYKNIELIIIDDCSDQDHYEYLETLSKTDDRIKLYRMTKNSGTYVSKNYGIRKSMGDYITFQDSDDYSHPCRLEIQLKELKKSGKRACHTMSIPVNDNGYAIRVPTSICEISLLVERSIIHEFGFYDNVRCSGDSEYRHRIGSVNIHKVDVPLYITYRGNNHRLTTIFRNEHKQPYEPRTLYSKTYNNYHKKHRNIYKSHNSRQLYPIPPQIEVTHHLNFVYNKFVIFVPYCHVYEKFIKECVDSIDQQLYPNYEIVLVNDGGTDLPFETSHRVLSFNQNRGPAFSKWMAIQHIRDNYSPNDIMMIVDGDDYLFEKSLHYINDKYNETKCWSTFGSAHGKWCDIQYTVDNWNDIRNSKWVWSHPRTFKVALLSHFTESDFKCEGKWLPKATDRELCYSIVERCGKEKVQFIDRPLYYYRDHESNCHKIVNNDTKKKILDDISTHKPLQKHVEDIHVIMLVYKRYEFLETTFTMLNNQVCDRHIHLHLINNNYDEKDKLEEIVSGLDTIFTLHITHYKNELFGFQRFPYIRDVVMKQYLADYVIIIDDDQLFSDTWVSDMWNKRKPETYSGWFCRKFTRHAYRYYNDTIVKFRDLIDNKKTDITKNMHYIGTGGCIIDTSIFLPNSLLWGTPDDFDVADVEDIWLSYVCKEKYGWKLERTCLPISENLCQSNDECMNQSQWLKLKDKKIKFLEYLIEDKDYFID